MLAGRSRMPPEVGRASPCHISFSQDGGVSAAAALSDCNDAFTPAAAKEAAGSGGWLGSGDGVESSAGGVEAAEVAEVRDKASETGEGSFSMADSLWVRRPSSMNGLKTMPACSSEEVEEPDSASSRLWLP